MSEQLFVDQTNVKLFSDFFLHMNMQNPDFDPDNM